MQSDDNYFPLINGKFEIPAVAIIDLYFHSLSNRTIPTITLVKMCNNSLISIESTGEFYIQIQKRDFAYLSEYEKSSILQRSEYYTSLNQNPDVKYPEYNQLILDLLFESFNEINKSEIEKSVNHTLAYPIHSLPQGLYIKNYFEPGLYINSVAMIYTDWELRSNKFKITLAEIMQTSPKGLDKMVNEFINEEPEIFE